MCIKLFRNKLRLLFALLFLAAISGYTSKNTDLQFDSRALDFNNEEIVNMAAGQRLSENILRAQNLIAANTQLDAALVILEETGENCSAGEKAIFCSAVNILKARGYLLKGSYSRSLNYAYKAISAGGGGSNLRNRALYIAGIDYIKLNQPEKAKKTFELIISSENFLADEAEKYLVTLSSGNAAETK